MTRLIKLGLVISAVIVSAQTPNYAIQQAAKEWRDYTSFQRDELISYCGFLYSEEQYDRAILGYFQYLYRFPGDSIESLITYRIARCYELTGKTQLAVSYFNRVLEISDSSNEVNRLAWYHMLSIFVAEEKYDTVLQLTMNASDPFDIIFRSYVHLHKMEWEDARQAIKAAEAKFNNRGYSRLARPLLQAIEDIQQVPRKKTVIAALASIIPGGGFAYLDKWDSATASALSFYGLIIAGYAYKSNSGILIPVVLTASGVYAASIWKAVSSVQATNHNNLQRYIDYIIERYPVSGFVDLDEPEIF
ncbi:MAG: hypothetical protein HQ528_00690 [Candidatus Marinimicrobia bacterium]|nr:hypothetical protein [Candidatus Neomarinimicrobiota bacterium]